MGSRLDFIKSWKGWIMGGILLVVLLSIVLPKWIFQWQISQLDLDRMDRIEYIKYEGEAFGSPIEIKKTLSIQEDSVTFKNLVGEIDEMNRSKVISSKGNEMLFFYHRDGRIMNAYIEDDLLGFDYGDLWLRVEKLDNIIEDMNFLEIVKVKEEKI